ncbi:MAG TPA: hypothetical protein VF997_22840, partial [Polyangia bacterium]
MGSSGRAALRAGALVALADGWALRHAWGSVGEHVAIALAVGAIVGGAALALAPWVALLVDRRRGRSLAAAALAGALVGVPLAATPTAQRALGLAAAALLLPLALAAALTAVARAPRRAAVVAGASCLGLELLLPLRLYPSLRVALVVVAFAALAGALARAAPSPRPDEPPMP